MRSRKLDAVVVGGAKHVLYFSAHLPDWRQHAAFVLFADGRSWLATANEPARNVAADEVVGYEANWLGTLRSDQPQTLSKLVLDRLGSSASRTGIDGSPVTAQVA